MLRRARQIEGRTVVIAGASSGIGRATALAFAREGAKLVLAARRAELLEEVAEECESAGAPATLVVPTDVTDAGAVQALATRAAGAFSQVDVWINNAGTGVFGPYHEADIALHRRTVEVNLFGAMHGAHAVLPVFKRQGRGVLINMVSLGGWAPTPFAAAYTASKFGIRGFTASLRQEIGPDEDIHICAIFPAMVDTPGFVHGANMSGKTLDPGPLLYRPEDVAARMVEIARHPQGEVAVGWPARAAQIAYNLSPRTTEIVVGATMRRLVSRAGPAPKSEGALLHPVEEGRDTDGGWLDRKGLPPAGKISTGLALAGLAGLAIAGRLAIAARRNGRRRLGA
jgi:short-subunit dehydrogenase